MLFRFLTWAVSGQPNYILTSRPYAIEVTEETEAEQATISAIRYTNQSYEEAEATEASAPIVSTGDLRQTLISYVALPEATDAAAPLISTGTLINASSPIIPYDYAEATDANSPTAETGTLEELLILYSNYPPEATDASAPTITGGSLA